MAYFLNGALTIGGHQQLAADTATTESFPFLGYGQATPPVYGDVQLLTDHAHGGNDSIRLNAFFLTVYGDAQTITGHADGGDDILILSARGVLVYGDAETLRDHAKGGNDQITSNGIILGDGNLSDHAKGGDDVIHVLNSDFIPTSVYGDGKILSGFARGGDDVLIASGSNDVLWGDGQLQDKATGGHDRFIFGAPGSLGYGGQDKVMDFRTGEDLIDLTGLAAKGIHGIGDLSLRDTAAGLVIGLGADVNHLEATITLAGIHRVTASDFVFG